MPSILFTLLISLSAVAQANWVQDTPLAREVNEYVQQSAGLLLRASQQAPRDTRLRDMAAKAQQAEVWDATADRTICTTNAAMRADMGGVKIYACPPMNLAYLTNEMKLQMVLHEIAHLTGVGTDREECEADRLARKVMADAGIRPQRSGYDEYCGTEGLY